MSLPLAVLRSSRPLVRAALPGAVLLALAAGRLSAQFTEIDPGLPTSAFPCVAPADYDGDGDVDLLLAGTGKKDVAFSTLFRNTAGSYADSGIVLIGLGRSAAGWADFDLDGDLDLAMEGQTTALLPTTLVWRNDGSTFATVPGSYLGVLAGSVAWGDADQDGDPDLIVCGVTGTAVGSPAATRLYRNDGNSFVSIPHPFGDTYVGAVAWADYDRDGDMDVAIAGSTTFGALSTTLWRNDGGSFADAGAGLPGMDLGEMAWADMDLDGDLDLLWGGNTDIGWVTQIWRNDAGSFVDMNAGLLGLLWSAGAWADYDRDGDPDLALMGWDPVAQVGRSLVYRNDLGSFSESGFSFHNVYLGTTAWLDDDSDGDPDLLLAGNEVGQNILVLEHNNTPASPWVNLGLGLAGRLGLPTLTGLGPLTAGSSVTITLSGALPGRPATMVVGFVELLAPFKGGTLVPKPALMIPMVTDPAGQIVLPATWPAGVPGGVSVWMQDWISDPGGPHGLSASNGLKAIAH
jgi:FG-GAP-like repeat